jgi:hypothetical protein
MRFHLKELVLWPRLAGFPPKRIPFVEGELNVITGLSRTGKSAVIPIIDYCLASRHCAVPVGVIREQCAWFGVVVSTGNGEKLLARKEPGANDASGERLVLEGEAITVPETIAEGNTTADKVRRLLDDLAGLTLLDFDAEEGAGSTSKARPSFRDMMAFTMQPQNIVANQNVLFYRADSFEHREKLRTIFPYVLNAVTGETLAKQHELAEVSRELRRKERELAALQEVSERWVGEIRAWVTEARELGLLTLEMPPETEVVVMLDALRHLVSSSDRTLRITEQTIATAVVELVRLQNAEQELARELARDRHRLQEMTRLRESASQYHRALNVQRDRLKLADWLAQIATDTTSCPVCGSSMATAAEELAPFIASLREIEASAGQFSGVSEAFDRELARVRQQVRVATERLESVAHQIRALTQTSGDARAQQDATLAASRFIGRLQQALESYERITADSALVGEVETLRERESDLRASVAEAEIRDKIRIATSAVATLAERIVPLLDAEYPDHAITLSVNDLSIKVAGNGREDFLWQIGSGSNWLSYHVAVTLALQQYFLTLPRSPVPSFLIFDQPSQVYFPKRLAERRDEPSQEPLYRDVDAVAVRRFFEVLANAAAEYGGRLQVIVLDHAADTIWGDVANIHLAAEWRENGDRLVPLEWIAAARGA